MVYEVDMMPEIIELMQNGVTNIDYDVLVDAMVYLNKIIPDNPNIRDWFITNHRCMKCGDPLNDYGNVEYDEKTKQIVAFHFDSLCNSCLKQD